MAVSAVLSSRPALENDRGRLANLLHFETFVHRHLDWRRPLDWLGHEPYLILESSGHLAATLACPQDPAGVAWVRLFGTAARVSPAEAWAKLWPQALAKLRELQVQDLAAIPLQDWFRDLLLNSGFKHSHNVVVLEWRANAGNPSPESDEFKIRAMQAEDLVQVAETDRAAFAPLWQNSLEAIKLAFDQAGSATVIQQAGRIAAFQLSTIGTQGLHLARLATHPSHQGKGLAKALIRELQAKALARKDKLITVNTQDNNLPSLALYKKLGFELTGEAFPVYEFFIE
jgi:ribosomal protein S18 acetylase RimI-like enzyme